jgi:hypothetical protein
MVMFPIADIVFDVSIYPRNGISSTNVARMIKAAEVGVRFPDIVLESETHRLVDGWHRCEVNKQRKAATIAAIEKVYNTEGDVYADAVRLNIGHGLPLDVYSTRRAVIRLEQYGYTREAICDVIKVSSVELGKIYRGFAYTDDGEPVAVKGGLSHLGGRVLNGQQQCANRNYGGPKATYMAKMLAELLENDMWPRTDNFQREMHRILNLWAALTGRTVT